MDKTLKTLLMSELLQLFDLLANRPELLASMLEQQDHASLDRLKSTLLELSPRSSSVNAVEADGAHAVVPLTRDL